MIWSASYEKTRIAIDFQNSLKGYYDLITQKACPLCSYPLTMEDECPRLKVHPEVHSKFVAKGYTIGLYSSYSGRSSDFLSKHIANLKHYRNKAEPLGSAIVELIKNRDSELLKTDCIVFVPQHTTELHFDRDSGSYFDQACELAKIVSDVLKIPVMQALGKKRPQSMEGLNAAQRKQAVTELYECKSKSLSGKYVLLVDDVSTSDSTLGACAEEIMKSGANEVRSYVCAINRLT